MEKLGTFQQKSQKSSLLDPQKSTSLDLSDHPIMTTFVNVVIVIVIVVVIIVINAIIICRRRHPSSDPPLSPGPVSR